MKKVININFQGRIIPIEESAYDMLKQYIESLRLYFAQEESRDEIINDIEGRIAELFSERLKKGLTCITDADVDAVIANMGRPEELEAAAMEAGPNLRNDAPRAQQTSTYQDVRPQGGLFRNADDKVIGGVCSGIANYLGIDPVIVRILFVLLFGAIFWVYILLWIVIPSKSIQTNITKRLYRSPDQQVFGGVCGGLSAYFSLDLRWVRLIFAAPLLFAFIFSGPFHFFTGGWDFMPGLRFAGGGLSGSFILAYIILWIAVPVASTAAERLEMKGEKIDMNSISSKVKEDLESLKGRAVSWGAEVKDTAARLKDQAQQMKKDSAPLARNAGTGLRHVIRTLFKVVGFFILGFIAIVLFTVLIGMLFGGYALLPLKDFFIESGKESLWVWASLILFLGVPVVGLITWLIRRIVGVRSGKHYLGWIFGGLWILGWVSIVVLAGMIAKNFRVRSVVREDLVLVKPDAAKMILDVQPLDSLLRSNDYFEGDRESDWPIVGLQQDSFLLNTVKVNLVRSRDNQFHVQEVRMSRGEDVTEARRLAEKITFQLVQQDSLILLPPDFTFTKRERFHNQQVLLIVEVPVGKRVDLRHNLERFNWFSIRSNRGLNFEIDSDDKLFYDVAVGREYLMTEEGPQEVSSVAPNAPVNRTNDRGVTL